MLTKLDLPEIHLSFSNKTIETLDTLTMTFHFMIYIIKSCQRNKSKKASISRHHLFNIILLSKKILLLYILYKKHYMLWRSEFWNGKAVGGDVTTDVIYKNIKQNLFELNLSISFIFIDISIK